MPINPDAVGATADPVDTSWTSKDALLYAVGVGAGTNELAFITENTNGVEQQVLPTFAVVVGWGRASAAVGQIGTFNPAMLVHGEQAVSSTSPSRSRARRRSRRRSSASTTRARPRSWPPRPRPCSPAARRCSPTRSSLFIRGEGGWGGDRGPSGPVNVPPERAARPSGHLPDPPDQALIYRLSGDRNPLHSDPSFAAMGGFDRPILHGLCTYGFTGRALLHCLAGSEAARFQHIEGRFSSPVLPGDALTVSIWNTGDGEAVFTTATQDGTVVIDQGLCRFRS